MNLSKQILLLCFLSVGIFSESCSGCEQQPSTPKEAIVQGRATNILPFLDKIAELKNTPAATYAFNIKKALSQCPANFVMRAPPEQLHTLLDHLSCENRSATSQSEPIRFFFPLGEGNSVLAGTIEIDEQGGVVAKGNLSGSGAETKSILLPSSKGPGKKILSRGELIHARLRSKHGLDLSSLVAKDDQFNNIFHLKSKLFTQTILDDTIEFAAYVPREGEPMPDMVVAFGINSQRAVTAAIDEFVGSLEKHWSLIRSDRLIGGYKGTCFKELQILPGLAPCIITTKQAFIIGWNAASLERSIMPSHYSSKLDDRSNVSIFFDNFPLADTRLTKNRIPNAPPPSQAYPFSKATVTATGTNSETLLQLELLP